MSRKQSPISSDYDRPTLSRGDVAAQLKKSTKTVVRLVAAGLLTETRCPSTGTRSVPRYSQAAVDAYRGMGYAAR